MAWEVFLYRDDGASRHFQQPDGTVIVVSRDDYSPQIKPTFTLHYEGAQNLIEALQKVGVRPIEASKVEGQLEAQSAHLADLQNIL
ncbi:MAG: hypothetical protein ACRC75_10045, partial [Olsenella sp.]